MLKPLRCTITKELKPNLFCVYMEANPTCSMGRVKKSIECGLGSSIFLTFVQTVPPLHLSDLYNRQLMQISNVVGSVQLSSK